MWSLPWQGFFPDYHQIVQEMPLKAKTKELEATFEECISLQRTDIILDCKAVAYMDSDALQLLVRMHETLRNRGNLFKIIGLNDVCLDIFVATRLIHLNVYEDIHEAMRNTQ